jgi:hypothetical protein
MHEYFTEYPPLSYRVCTDCAKRTPHICLKCNYCFSCHYKVERLEKSEKVSSLTAASKQEKPRPPRDISMYQVKFVTYKLKRKQSVGRRFKSGYT